MGTGPRGLVLLSFCKDPSSTNTMEGPNDSDIAENLNRIDSQKMDLIS